MYIIKVIHASVAIFLRSENFPIYNIMLIFSSLFHWNPSSIVTENLHALVKVQNLQKPDRIFFFSLIENASWTLISAESYRFTLW